MRRRADKRHVLNRDAVTPARPGELTIRLATATDSREVERLAQLDSAESPTGPTLVAEVEGELVAALPLEGGKTVADPFRRTGEVVHLLELRAAQLNGEGHGLRQRTSRTRAQPRAAER